MLGASKMQIGHLAGMTACNWSREQSVFLKAFWDASKMQIVHGTLDLAYLTGMIASTMAGSVPNMVSGQSASGGARVSD